MPERINNTSSRPLPSDRPVVDWYASYINSPKYKERLSAFYKYPEYIQRQRADVLRNVSYRENPGTKSRYYENGNEIAMSDLQVKALNTTRAEIMSHELGHSINSNTKAKGAALSPQEEDFILKRNKQLSQASYDRFKALSKETGSSMNNLLDGESHDVNPGENLSDIQSLRYLLKQRKLYDAGTQDVTPDILKKAASDPVIRKSFIWKRLKESFGEKELQEIMNKVAANKSNNNSNIV